MTTLKLLSATDSGITTISKEAASLSSALNADGLELSGDCVTLNAGTAEIAACGAWMMQMVGAAGEEKDGAAEGDDDGDGDPMASLEATPAKFVAVLALADFLSLEELVVQLVAKERTVSLRGRGFTSSLEAACAAAIPGWAGILADYRAKLVTAAVSPANFNSGGPQWGGDPENPTMVGITARVDWKEAVKETEEGRLFYQYVKKAYPKARDYDNEQEDLFTGCTKLLFSAVARKDAGTLRAVLSDARVVALGRPDWYWGHWGSGFGDEGWEENGKAWHDTGDVVVEDEGAAGVSLLQYAAETDAAACAEVILQLGAEPVDLNGVWDVKPIHAACWHANLETLKTLVAHGASVHSKTQDGYGWQGYRTTDMGCTPMHLCYLGVVARKLGRKKPLGLCLEEEEDDEDDEDEDEGEEEEEEEEEEDKEEADTDAEPQTIRSRLGRFLKADGKLDAARGCASVLLEAGADVDATTGPLATLGSGGWANGPGCRDAGSCGTAVHGERGCDDLSQLSCLHLATICADSEMVTTLLTKGAKQQPLGCENHTNYTEEGELICCPPGEWSGRLLFGMLPVCLWSPPLALALATLTALGGAEAEADADEDADEVGSTHVTAAASLKAISAALSAKGVAAPPPPNWEGLNDGDPDESGRQTVAQQLAAFDGGGDTAADEDEEAEADGGDSEPASKRRKAGEEVDSPPSQWTLAKAALLLARGEECDASRAVAMLTGETDEAAFTASLLRADCLARAGQVPSATAAYEAYWQAANQLGGGP